MATTHTMDCAAGVSSGRDTGPDDGKTHLYSEEEEVEVEVAARKDVFIRDGHENGRGTVGENGKDWVVGDCRTRRNGHLGWWRWRLVGDVSLLFRSVVALFVGHDGRCVVGGRECLRREGRGSLAEQIGRAQKMQS